MSQYGENEAYDGIEFKQNKGLEAVPKCQNQARYQAKRECRGARFCARF